MKKRKGFTLIEIMVAVILLGVLASLALIKYNSVMRKANEHAIIVQLGVLHDAFSVYYNRAHEYPALGDPSLEDLNTTLGLNLTTNNGTDISGISSGFAYYIFGTYVGSDPFRVCSHDYNNTLPFTISMALPENDLFNLQTPGHLLRFLDDFVNPPAYALMGGGIIIVLTHACVAASPNPCCAGGKCPTLPNCS